MAVFDTENRKIMASGVALAAVTGYAVWDRADFSAFANAVEWILGIYITGHAAQGIAGAKFGLLGGVAQGSPVPPPPSEPPRVKL